MSWKPVLEEGFEGMYEVNELGEVRSTDKFYTRENGEEICIYHGEPATVYVRGRQRSARLWVWGATPPVGKDVSVARLVWNAFHDEPLPEGKRVRHANGNSLDDSLSNLEIAEQAEVRCKTKAVCLIKWEDDHVEELHFKSHNEAAEFLGIQAGYLNMVMSKGGTIRKYYPIPEEAFQEWCNNNR